MDILCRAGSKIKVRFLCVLCVFVVNFLPEASRQQLHTGHQAAFDALVQLPQIHT